MSGSVFGSSLSADAGGRVARLMFYIMAAVVLMVLDHRGGHVEQVRSTAALAVEPMLVLIESPFRFATSGYDQFRDRRTLLAERSEFERLLRESHARLLLLEELGRENAELRELLGASASLDLEFQTAEMRQIDLHPYSHRVVINRGRRHGIEPGQAVVDARGVVGQVDEAMLNSAKVILLSDPDHALPVRVERTRLRTIAYGSGRTGELRLTDLPMNVELEPGDRLLTSGLGGRFPSGLPVAEVTSIERPSGEAFAVATARPLANLDGARHLLVLATVEPESMLDPALELLDLETVETGDDPVDEPTDQAIDETIDEASPAEFDQETESADSPQPVPAAVGEP